MKRILLSMGILSVVGVGAYLGATGAFFSDTETSSGNTFTAGSIDLSIGSQFTSAANGNGSHPLLADNDGRALYNFTDIKPGDSGSGSFDLEVNSNESYACALATLDSTPDNGIVDPEGDAGDVTDGPTGGELQNFLQIAIFHDMDGDGVYDAGEPLNINQTGDGNGFTFAEVTAAGWIAVADNSAPNTWLAPNSSLTPGNEYHAGFMYCFGNFNGSGACTMYPPTSNDNLAQTDSISGSIQFQAVQTRNNAGFLCSQLPNNGITPEEGEVNQDDLFTTNDRAAAFLSGDWFFYNDTNDTIMAIDEFATSSGQNHMEAIAGSEGAKMVLHGAGGATNPRYNIATYRYNNILLNTINQMSYRVYDATADSDKPFLHFNVSFNGADTFQRRLVHVPAVLPVGAWTVVDAYQGGAAMWTYSGPTWPAGIGEPGTTPGTTAKSWSTILATYPNIQTRSTDSFFGVRVGQPGPAGATGFVDYINFDGEVSDFEI